MFAITITNDHIYSSLTKENMSFPSTSSGVSLLHYCTKMFLIKKQNKTKNKNTQLFNHAFNMLDVLLFKSTFSSMKCHLNLQGAPSGKKKKKKTNPLHLHLTLIPFWIRLVRCIRPFAEITPFLSWLSMVDGSYKCHQSR